MTCSDWIEGRYLRQRRNLNALSIAMFVFVIGGGSVMSGTPTQLPGGLMTISLERPTIVIALAWASLLYFMWRYWLVSAELRSHIADKRKNAYHWTPYVQRIIAHVIEEHDLLPGVAHGSIEYKTGQWVLIFGQVSQSNGQKFIDVPEHRLPLIPFALYAWLAEIKSAWVSPEFSEYYTPFFLAWLAILCAFILPALRDNPLF